MTPKLQRYHNAHKIKSYKVVAIQIEAYLVCHSGNEALKLSVGRKLTDMFHHPFHHLDVTFPECRHQTGNLSIILTVNVCPCCNQELNNIQVAP